MNKESSSSFLDRPPFLIGGALVAVISGLMGWIGYEYVAICVGAAIVGLVLYKKKNHPAGKPK